MFEQNICALCQEHSDEEDNKQTCVNCLEGTYGWEHERCLNNYDFICGNCIHKYKCMYPDLNDSTVIYQRCSYYTYLYVKK